MELNKIAGAILLAGLIAMITGKVSTILYHGGADAGHHGEAHHETRGYSIEVVEAPAGAAVAAQKELASIIPLLHSADVAAGEKFFGKKCATCHTSEQGGKTKTGPNLWDIVNRDKGAAGDFKYSKALTAKEGDWNYDALNGFLHKPKKWLPGTIMAYAGIRKDQDRADLIAYLRSLSNAPAAIPAAPAPAVEDAVEEESAGLE